MDVAFLRQAFEPYLQAFLTRKQRDVQAYINHPDLRRWLAEPERLISAGGKRVRPLMCLLGYFAASGTLCPAIYEAAVSLELFHLFALIHDDVMDHGCTRHGVPTVHCRVAQDLRDLKRTGALDHVGCAQAIIIGDLLFSWVHEGLRTVSFPAAEMAEAMRRFFAMSDEVMVGQMLDIDLTTRNHSTLAEMEQKMRLKTAGYTFIKPLQIGMAFANHQSPLFMWAEQFGTALGLAFQIQDDILDAFGSIEETGKTALSDVRDHQHSLLTQGLLERGTPEEVALLTRVWGVQSATAAEHEALRAAFVRTGVFADVMTRCLAETKQALACVARVELSDDARPLFADLVQRAVSLEKMEVFQRSIEHQYGS